MKHHNGCTVGRRLGISAFLAWAILAQPFTLSYSSARQMSDITSGKNATEPQKKESQLQGSHIVVGTIQEISGEEIKVNTGEVQPRFLPLNLAKEKGFPT